MRPANATPHWVKLRIVDAYQRGMSQKEIEQAYQHGNNVVRKALAEFGIEKRGRGHPRAVRAAMAERYLSGETVMEIARSMKLSHESVRRALKKDGVQMRTAQPRARLEKQLPAWKRLTLIEQVLARIEIRGECWHWTGGTTEHGQYGRIMHRKVTHAVHRVTWEHYNGPLGKDRLTGTCGDPCCCNPDHRKIVTNDPWEEALAGLTVDPDSHCWLIATGKKRARMARRHDGRLPNRIAWKTWRGELSAADEVWRRCENLRCINPDHLVLVPKNTGRHEPIPLLHSDLLCDQGHLMVGADARTVEHGSGQPTRRCLVCQRKMTERLLAEPIEEELTPRERFRRMRAEQKMAELLGVG